MGLLCVGQHLGEGEFQFLNGFPVQTGQGTQETVTLQGTVEIQHGTTGLT